MSVSIPDLCEELKRHVGRSERTDLGIIRREAFQRFAVAADNLNPVFFEADSAKAAGYPDVIAPPLSLDGPTLTIRKFRKDKLKLEDLVRFTSITPEGSRILAVIGRYLDGENALADGLQDAFGPGQLNLADRGFFSMHRWIRPTNTSTRWSPTCSDSTWPRRGRPTYGISTYEMTSSGIQRLPLWMLTPKW